MKLELSSISLILWCLVTSLDNFIFAMLEFVFHDIRGIFNVALDDGIKAREWDNSNNLLTWKFL